MLNTYLPNLGLKIQDVFSMNEYLVLVDADLSGATLSPQEAAAQTLVNQAAGCTKL